MADLTLKEWRKLDGRSLVEVATAAKTSDATISRIENGLQRPTPDLARRLAKVTGIPAERFVMGEAC